MTLGMGLGCQIELGLQGTTWLALFADVQRLTEVASLGLQRRVRVGIIDRSSKVALPLYTAPIFASLCLLYL